MKTPKKFNQFKNVKKTSSEDLFIRKETWKAKEEIWSKNKEVVIIICKDGCWKMSRTEWSKFDKFINAVEKIESQNKPINSVKPLKMEGKKKMIENFVIGSRDATLTIGSLSKAKEAKPAIKAVKAVKEIIAIAPVPEKKDPKTGKVIQKKVKEIKGIKGVEASPAIPAQPAKPEIRTVVLKCRTEEVAQEIIARMADQGHELVGEMKHIDPGTFDLTYKAESDKPIRAAFKKCKAKDGYNKAGLDILSKKKKAAAKAKKDAEGNEEVTVSGKKKDDDSDPDSGADSDPDPEDEGGWPES